MARCIGLNLTRSAPLRARAEQMARPIKQDGVCTPVSVQGVSMNKNIGPFSSCSVTLSRCRFVSRSPSQSDAKSLRREGAPAVPYDFCQGRMVEGERHDGRVICGASASEFCTAGIHPAQHGQAVRLCAGHTATVNLDRWRRLRTVFGVRWINASRVLPSCFEGEHNVRRWRRRTKENTTRGIFERTQRRGWTTHRLNGLSRWTFAPSGDGRIAVRDF